MTSVNALCRCGHTRTVHQHYRRGDDCGICGDTCPTYRRPSLLAGLVHWFAPVREARTRADRAELDRIETDRFWRNFTALQPFAVSTAIQIPAQRNGGGRVQQSGHLRPVV